ncbi:MAG: hypothetical protein K6U14_05065 [Firmicutes bacterium]|nr:hypothetical protein [Alicyclobacillaceae bacterium]MCL6496992.1 hypothetical protein [Bacillota bacterium]
MRPFWALLALVAALGAVALWRLLLPPQPPAPVLPVALTGGDPLLAMPWFVAQRLGAFRTVGVLPEPAPGGIRLGPPLPWTAPVMGYLAVRPDVVLVAPTADPHFRWAQVQALPLAYQADDPAVRTWTEAVLAQHSVRPRSWEPLSQKAIAQLWPRQYLPYAVVPLTAVPTLERLCPTTHILAFLGGSTGPLPILTVNGRNPALIRFLAGLNLGLWYLHTEPPNRIGRLLAGVDGRSAAEWAKLDALGRRYRLWPATTYPDAALWHRLEQWQPTAPDYRAAVEPEAALSALQLLP